jgi:hypothetical protein
MSRFSRLLLCLSLLFSASVVWSGGVQLELPPASLAQWYKPANKRQVWLHTMFRLRREMQAVEQYAAERDQVHVKKWGQRLAKDYSSIADMVPEWREELELDWLDTLKEAITSSDFERVSFALKKLRHSCHSCHDSYQAQTVLLYRVPDYHELKFAGPEQGEVTYPDLMERLSLAVNQIKISIDDQAWQKARNAVVTLEGQLDVLRLSCAGCHKASQPEQQILGEESRQLLTLLDRQIEQKLVKPTASTLGKLAVAVCAKCHGIHRTLGDLKHRIEK